MKKPHITDALNYLGFIIKAYLFMLLYPLLKRHYKIKIANTKHEKEKVFEFRYKIYRQELKHHFLDQMVTEKNMLFDESDYDENVLILYSGDINNITGTVKMSSWDRNMIPTNVKDKYSVPENVIANAMRIGELRFLQVRRDYRKGLLGLCHLAALFEVSAQRGLIPAEIYLCDCQPGLIRNYQHVGGIPYTHKLIYKDFGILFVPLMITPYDLNTSKRIHNILYFIIKHYMSQITKRLSLEHMESISKCYASIPRIKLTYSRKEMKQYAAQMKTDIGKENAKFILSLLSDFTVLTLEPDTTLIQSGIVDYDMFLLLEGLLDISINQIIVTTLEPGALLGEMALLDVVNVRYVDVTSKVTSKVLLIPRNILFLLEKHNSRLAIKLLHLLCNNLISKLSITNKLLISSTLKEQNKQ